MKLLFDSLIVFLLLAAPVAAQDALKAGDAAPDMTVTTLGGDSLKLSDRFGDDGKPTVLLFSRAHW